MYVVLISCRSKQLYPVESREIRSNNIPVITEVEQCGQEEYESLPDIQVTPFNNGKEDLEQEDYEIIPGAQVINDSEEEYANMNDLCDKNDSQDEELYEAI